MYIIITESIIQLNLIRKMKTYKTKGLDYYVINCRNIIHAELSFLHYRVGVTTHDIEEYEGIIPDNAYVVEAV